MANGYLKEVRKSMGLCVQCGTEMDRKGDVCQRCNKLNNKSKHKITLGLHERNLCTTCREPMDRVGWLCKKCLGKLNDLGTERNAYRRVHGLCTACGEKAEDNLSMCRKCLDRLKERREYRKIIGDGVWIKR